MQYAQGEKTTMNNKLGISILLLLLLPSLALVPITASATGSETDRIQGTVYENGVPKEGLIVKVYRLTTLNGAPGVPPLLEGYSTDHNNDPAWLGEDITDANGQFAVAWLYAWDNQYRVVVLTPVGELVQETKLACYTPVCLEFRYTVCSPGTGTPGYWKNHPEAWPVSEITIGGVTYTRDEAIAEMWAKKNNDKTYTMFSALVATRLNVYIGNAYASVANTMIEADQWLADNPLGTGVKGSSSAWKVGEPLYLKLDQYNNGLLDAPHRD